MLLIAHLLQPIDLLLRAVGRICPDIRTAHCVATDQLVLYICRDMVLVAKEILTILFGLPGIGILLASLVIAPIVRLDPRLDLLVFLSAVVLGRHADNVGINYLPFLRPETSGQQKCVELREQRLYHSCVGKIVTESPDGRAVGNLACGMQAKKPRKRVTIENLVLQSLIRQIVQRLQNEALNIKMASNPMASASISWLPVSFFRLWVEKPPNQ